VNRFKIYKSSAGSGKTYTLVKEYLRLALKKPDEYKHILALTFTNKATAEMKSRIVESLIELAKPVDSQQSAVSSLEATLAADCGLKTEDLRKNAQLVLDNILHDYSNFSISTIDSFFNRIVRSLAKEIQLPLRLDIQMDTDEVALELSHSLLEEISSDKELSAWLTDFAFQKLRDDKGWNLEMEIQSIAKELFKEKSVDQKTHSRKEIQQLFSELKLIKSEFENRMKSFGAEGLKLISSAGLTVDDFSRKSSGPAGYFGKIVKRNADYSFNSYQKAGLDSAEAWGTKSSPLKNQIFSISESSLMPLLISAFVFYEKEYPQYVGAVEVLKRIFLLGIVEDLKKKLATYRSENNLLLISDTPQLLSKVISEDEAPFIYEKSGNRYHHLLIDEFQDTSDLQWKNLLPLIVNSLSSGNFSMVVGDVKQSIYRWRSGNMNLLDSEIKQHLSPFKSLITEENLDTNFRSKKTIVDFNNEFFGIVPEVINQSLELDSEHLLHRAYSAEVMQKVAGKNGSGGKVEIHSIKEDELSWKERAQQKLLETIVNATARGYSFGDIAILARNNRDGDELATFLIANNITKVISADSLLLNRSAEVRFLISLFRSLNDPKDHIAAGEVLFYYASHNGDSEKNLHQLFSQTSKSRRSFETSSGLQPSLFDDHLSGLLDLTGEEMISSSTLATEFIQHKQSLSRLPVYELAEELIKIFKLRSNDPYILRFLDLILEYAAKHDSSSESFLNWWDEAPAARNASVVTSDNADAIQIMTIHRSKGLQFPVVIIPYANWSISPKTGDVLWIESGDAPFSLFGKLPVGSSKSLKGSVFKKGYEDEIVLTAVDNINLLYVAFTRAEDELYIFFEESSTETMNTVGKVIRNVLEKIPEWQTEFSGNNKIILGENGNGSARRKPTKEDIEIKDFSKLDWHSKIRLNLKSEELLDMFDQLPTQHGKAINYGVLVHRVLSSINNVADADRAIEQIFSEGLINSEEKVKLKSELKELLSEESISNFFESDTNVMAEREIILPDGEVLRPDRVLIAGEVATVIDFKTGKEQPSHRRQINRYADALQRMNYKVIEKYLIYIPEKRIVQIA